MNFSEAVAGLDARSNYERTGRLTAPTLDRIAALVDMLDHPERGYPVIHITGTNGKTTVARAATEVLRAAGLKVATYTSPHVSDIRERFHYDGSPISAHDFVEAWRELEPYLKYFDGEGERITWFEAATALALIWFADKAVEAAVIEVGMGGSWDATNVVDADVAAFTEVGVDHPELGATPAETAVEKAGILKRVSIPVSVVQPPEVADVLGARAGEVGAAAPRFEPDAFALDPVAVAMGGQQLTFRIGGNRYDEVFLPMFGEHAARDAVLGAAAAHAVVGDVAFEPEVIRTAFANVSLPGRMEVVHRHPLVVIDGAHNAAAARALTLAMMQSFTWETLRAVVSIMDNKDARAVLAPLVAIADEVILARNGSPRATAPEVLADVVRALGGEATIVEAVPDAVAVAIERSEDADAVLVAGSLYTAGEARSKLSS